MKINISRDSILTIKALLLSILNVCQKETIKTVKIEHYMHGVPFPCVALIPQSIELVKILSSLEKATVSSFFSPIGHGTVDLTENQFLAIRWLVEGHLMISASFQMPQLNLKMTAILEELNTIDNEQIESTRDYT